MSVLQINMPDTFICENVILEKILKIFMKGRQKTGKRKQFLILWLLIRTDVKNINSARVALRNGYLFESVKYSDMYDPRVEEVKDSYEFVKLADKEKMKKLEFIQEKLKQVYDVEF